MKERYGECKRFTNETNVSVKLNIDGTANNKIDTKIGFLDHMLTLLSFHSKVDLVVEADGDIHVCDHHMVEDIGIAIGVALRQALQREKLSIKRYSTFYIPMDEALAMASIDVSGRAFLHFDAKFNRESIGNFSTEMVQEFFRAVAFNAGITLHLNVLYGENDHHKIEAIFKAFARALREALIIDGDEVSSSKGVLI